MLRFRLVPKLIAATLVLTSLPHTQASTQANGLYPSGLCEGRSAHYATKGWAEPVFATERRSIFFPQSPLHLTQRSTSWPLFWAGSKDTWVQSQPLEHGNFLALGFPVEKKYRLPPALFSLQSSIDSSQYLHLTRQVIGLALSDNQQTIALVTRTPARREGDKNISGARFVFLNRNGLEEHHQDTPLGPSEINGMYSIGNEFVVGDITIRDSMAHLADPSAARPPQFSSLLELKFSPDGRYLVARNEHELEIFRFNGKKLCQLQHSIAYPRLNEHFTAKHILFSSESKILRFIGWDAQHTSREAFDLSLDHLSCVK